MECVIFSPCSVPPSYPSPSTHHLSPLHSRSFISSLRFRTLLLLPLCEVNTPATLTLTPPRVVGAARLSVGLLLLCYYVYRSFCEGVSWQFETFLRCDLLGTKGSDVDTSVNGMVEVVIGG